MQSKINQYVKMWEHRCYSTGIPDEVPNEIIDKVPSYKLICKAILKNDIGVLGIIKPVASSYIYLKRIEISQRPTNEPKQLELF